MMQKGSRLLATVLPGLTPMVADTIERLRDTVPRALAEMASSGSSLPAGAGPVAPLATPMTPAMMRPTPMQLAA